MGARRRTRGVPPQGANSVVVPVDPHSAVGLAPQLSTTTSPLLPRSGFAEQLGSPDGRGVQRHFIGPGPQDLPHRFDGRQAAADREGDEEPGPSSTPYQSSTMRRAPRPAGGSTAKERTSS